MFCLCCFYFFRHSNFNLPDDREKYITGLVLGWTRTIYSDVFPVNFTGVGRGQKVRNWPRFSTSVVSGDQYKPCTGTPAHRPRTIRERRDERQRILTVDHLLQLRNSSCKTCDRNCFTARKWRFIVCRSYWTLCRRFWLPVRAFDTAVRWLASCKYPHLTHCAFQTEQNIWNVKLPPWATMIGLRSDPHISPTLPPVL